MRSSILFLLLPVLPLTLAGAGPGCFSPNSTWDFHDDQVLDFVTGVESVYDCQTICFNTQQCTNFTWTTDSNQIIADGCLLFNSVPDQEVFCDDCVSGPSSCPSCSEAYACEESGASVIDILVGVTIEFECQARCVDTDDCEFYTWYSEASSPVFKHLCILLSACGNIDTECSGCYTGPKYCTESPVECRNGGELVSTAPSGSMVICDDPQDETCEEDMEELCPLNWHLCTSGEFNNRNLNWNEKISGNLGVSRTVHPIGVIYCRQDSHNPDGAGSYGIGYTTKYLNESEPTNCWFGSSRPECNRYEGNECNEKHLQALCCKPSHLCGNGVVDAPEEDCDDGNLNDDDDCLTVCTWKTPYNHGVNGHNCN